MMIIYQHNFHIIFIYIYIYLLRLEQNKVQKSKKKKKIGSNEFRVPVNVFEARKNTSK